MVTQCPSLADLLGFEALFFNFLSLYFLFALDFFSNSFLYFKTFVTYSVTSLVCVLFAPAGIKKF